MKWLAIVLTAIFTTAKLMSVVTWSWWLVLLPAIIYIAYGIVLFIIALTIAWFTNIWDTEDVDNQDVTQWFSSLIIIVLSTLNMKQNT